ncbi:unnamed protein product [Symbiodinium sp. CCMP2592]|nr:unnamed protein product [Symbiodinium sp. CCMP2592]
MASWMLAATVAALLVALGHATAAPGAPPTADTCDSFSTLQLGTGVDAKASSESELRGPYRRVRRHWRQPWHRIHKGQIWRKYGAVTSTTPAMTTSSAFTSVDDSGMTSSTTVPSITDTGFPRISAGLLMTCALKEQDNFPVCWGLASSIGTVPTVALRELSCSAYCCRIEESSSMAICWGGETPTGQNLTAPAEPLTGHRVGRQQACALNAEKRAVCWGA